MDTIRNEYLTVSAARKGAELQSIRGADGTEYLWQGDPAVWSDRAPNIFPYVARLTRDTYFLDGKAYRMPIHGLAMYSRFALRARTADSMTLELTDSEGSRRAYPRRFAFRVVYALTGRRLTVTYEVENRDDRILYFGLGGHPGLRVPLTPELRFEDYRLRFSQPCRPVRVGFSEACFLNGEDRPFPLEQERILPLRHSLFDDDAIVLKDMCREVTLEAAFGPAITVRFPQMDYLGVWHMPKTDAGYVCVEPWCSLPSFQDRIAVLEEQKDLLSLAPGGLCRRSWSLEISPGETKK